MNLPKGWKKYGCNFYMGPPQPSLIRLIGGPNEGKWMASQNTWAPDSDGKSLGPFDTARAAFAALGIDVRSKAKKGGSR